MVETRETIARDIVLHQFPASARRGDTSSAEEDDRLDQVVVALRSEIASEALASEIESIQVRASREFFRSGYPVEAVDRLRADVSRRLRGN